jgi:hypothetical protein
VQCCLRLVDSLEDVSFRLSLYEEELPQRPTKGDPFANAVMKSSGLVASAAGGQRTRSIGVGVLPVHFKPFDGSDWESEAQFRKRAAFFAGIDWNQVTAVDPAQAGLPSDEEAVTNQGVVTDQEVVTHPALQDSASDSESFEDDDTYDYDPYDPDSE